MLNAVFNIDASLSEEAAIRIYVRSAVTSGKVVMLKNELAAAFADKDTSWKEILLNEDFEVFAAETEEEARAHAHRLLLEPLERIGKS